MSIKTTNSPILGWNEWVGLPELGVKKIRCKVDTGARTSALHAFYVEEFEENGIRRVRFGLHPQQKSTEAEIHCVCDVLDQREVTDSGGHTDNRIVIHTPVVLGKHTWPIEITLTNRDTMRYRMLLGRTAIAGNFIVDSGARHQMGSPAKKPVNLPLVNLRHDEEE